jgi:hypothetical protein
MLGDAPKYQVKIANPFGGVHSKTIKHSHKSFPMSLAFFFQHLFTRGAKGKGKESINIGTKPQIFYTKKTNPKI